MKLTIILLTISAFAAPLFAHATSKSAAKPTPTPTGAPPGYEEAKFVLPPIPFRAGMVSIPRNTTAPLKFNVSRGPIYLPKGSANVALRKPVTSSDDAPIIGELPLVSDGKKGEEEGDWVELSPGTQWVQIDLQKAFDIHGVLLWHYDEPKHWRVYRDVVIRTADDAAFTKNVRTVYNNDDDNSSGFGKGADREFYESNQGQWIPIKAQKARFVRLYSNGNTRDPLNHYTEVEVWAKPAK